MKKMENKEVTKRHTAIVISQLQRWFQMTCPAPSEYKFFSEEVANCFCVYTDRKSVDTQNQTWWVA